MRKAFLAVVLSCAAGLAHARQEIRLWHGMSGALGAELDRLVGRYNASQQRYRVLSYFQGPYDEAMAQEIRRRGARRAPHVVQVNDAGTADMLRSRAARPLQEVMRQARRRLDAKYLPAVSAHFSDAEGRLLGLPFTGATPVLYYNRDAFRNARLDPARPPKTWSEMPDALGALLESGQSCGLTSAWQSWVLVENMNARHNQRFATAPAGTPPPYESAGARLAFNNRLMVRWISTLASWQKAGYFTYAGRAGEAEARFASGECALLTSTSAAYAELRTRAGFDFAVAQFPYYDDFDDAPGNTLVGASALWALGGKPAADYRGVADFFAWLARPAVQAE
jgi:sn-glycerol 3-phosphate transport system substrate-binding protein